MQSATIAIIGSPNVGKSTLFNAFIGKKIAIVHDEPGVTRDRIHHNFTVGGITVMLVDTGGLLMDPKTGIELGIRDQALLACDEADLALFVVDGRIPPPAKDQEIARFLQKRSIPVIVVANKLDNEHDELTGFLYERLGLGRPELISALRRRNMASLRSRMVSELPRVTTPPSKVHGPSVAIVGKPNVGKSSLLNRLVGRQRSIVDDIPGTTRDAVDTPVDFDGNAFLLIDTAGIRRRSHHADGVPYFAYLRASKALARSDIAIMVFDAQVRDLEVVEVRLAHQAMQYGKSLLPVVNKWDLVTEPKMERDRWLELFRRKLGFLGRVEPRFISAKTGRGVGALPRRLGHLATRRSLSFTPPQLAALLAKSMAHHAPPSFNGRAVHLYRIAQQGARHPKFVLYTNYPAGLPESYIRYLRNVIRDGLDLHGVGFDLHVRQARSES